MTPKVIVGNLADTTTGEDLRSLFSAYGNVAEVHLPIEPAGGRLRGFAIITMATQHGAQAAILALNGKEVAARALRVTEHVQTKKAPPASRPKATPRGWW